MELLGSFLGMILATLMADTELEFCGGGGKWSQILASGERGGMEKKRNSRALQHTDCWGRMILPTLTLLG